jgi:hypothetical protein
MNAKWLDLPSLLPHPRDTKANGLVFRANNDQVNLRPIGWMLKRPHSPGRRHSLGSKSSPMEAEIGCNLHTPPEGTNRKSLWELRPGQALMQVHLQANCTPIKLLKPKRLQMMYLLLSLWRILKELNGSIELVPCAPCIAPHLLLSPHQDFLFQRSLPFWRVHSIMQIPPGRFKYSPSQKPVILFPDANLTALILPG